jgi:hypothetical protein
MMTEVFMQNNTDIRFSKQFHKSKVPRVHFTGFQANYFVALNDMKYARKAFYAKRKKKNSIVNSFRISLTHEKNKNKLSKDDRKT